MTRQAAEPTQTSVQWVLGLFPQGKVTGAWGKPLACS
jgi:hypothetical protein